MEGIIVRSLSQRSHPGRSVTLLKNLQGKNWKNYRAEKSEKLKREDNIDRFIDDDEEKEIRQYYTKYASKQI